MKLIFGTMLVLLTKVADMWGLATAYAWLHTETCMWNIMQTMA